MLKVFSSLRRCSPNPDRVAIAALILLGPLWSSSPLLAQQQPIAKADQSAMMIDLTAQTTGQNLSINGKTYFAPWLSWQESGQTRIAIADVSGEQILGLRLLTNPDPQRQPVEWFGRRDLPVVYTDHQRYLDITEVLREFKWTFSQDNNGKGAIAKPATTITDVNFTDGGNNYRRLWLTLDGPTTFQLSNNGKEAIMMLDGTVNLGSPDPATKMPQGVTLLNQNRFQFTVTPTDQIAIYTLDRSNEIVVDIGPKLLAPRTITWDNGLQWHQELLTPNAPEPVALNFVKIPDQPDRFRLEPRLNPLNHQTVLNTFRNTDAIAGINAGFFNRDRQLGLGAIKTDNQWRSGPILNRGVVGWDDQLNLTMDHLYFAEQANGVPISLLNTAYVQRGVARYDRLWGNTYTPLLDYEIIISIAGDRVTEILTTNPQNKPTVTIPQNGYLLAIRGNDRDTLAQAFPQGQVVNLRPYQDGLGAYPNVIGAGPLLVQNSRIVLNAAAEGFSTGFINQKASRSAIAVNGQGEIFLVAAHGKVSLDRMAQIMVGLGAVQALNLDGGSSTGLYVGGQLIDRSPVTGARVNNAIGIFPQP